MQKHLLISGLPFVSPPFIVEVSPEKLMKVARGLFLLLLCELSWPPLPSHCLHHHHRQQLGDGGDDGDEDEDDA